MKKTKYITIGLKKNLCDYCHNEYPTCNGKDVKFGIGKGNDNIIQCSSFVSNGTPEVHRNVMKILDDMCPAD